MNCFRCLLAFFAVLFSYFNVYSQDLVQEKKDLHFEEKEVVKYPKFQFKGLFQGRFVASLDQNVDVEGLHHSDNSGSGNTFLIKYMRIQAKMQISKHTEINVLANLADFKTDPKNKVLENAFVKYTFNPKLAITVGQFRPLFGLEETYPVDIIRSLDWSHQYSEFGKLGWESFQIGAAINGDLMIGKMPFQYAVSVVNGNGKNQVSDKDDGKQFSTRMVFGVSKKNNLKIGLNAGFGEVLEKNVYAFGLDAETLIRFSDKWNLDVQGEIKQGTNHTLFNSLKDEERLGNLKDYTIFGTYILPALRYEISNPNYTISALEITCRYEFLDRNSEINSNSQQIITPMFGMEFLKNYNARLQLGTQISRYKKQKENSLEHNSNLLVAQVQVRF